MFTVETEHPYAPDSSLDERWEYPTAREAAVRFESEAECDLWTAADAEIELDAFGTIAHTDHTRGVVVTARRVP